MVDKLKAVSALYDNVAMVEETADGTLIVKDADGNDVSVDTTQVNAWTDPDQYKHDRQQAYPKISDQLDMLWHSIDSGTLDKTSDFYTTLKQVKDDNPKPSEEQ